MATLTGERSHLCAIVTLAINTGLRVNELFGLEREDVDFHRDVLYIKHTKTDEDREVPLNDTARELLRRLIQAERKGGEFSLHQSKDRTRYTTIKTAWLTACRNAGLSNLRFHDDPRNTLQQARQMLECRCRRTDIRWDTSQFRRLSDTLTPLMKDNVALLRQFTRARKRLSQNCHNARQQTVERTVDS